MNLLTTILLGLAFVAIFCFLICKLKLFRRLGLSSKWLLLLFATKLVAAFALVGVYQIVYENENTGDINKYHKAGLVLYSAMEENPADYFKMVSGIPSGKWPKPLTRAGIRRKSCAGAFRPSGKTCV